MSKSNSSFPLDLVREILQKLPAKSIVRFRCVSKLWSSITTDSYFIKSFETRSLLKPSLLVIFKKSNKSFVFSFLQNHQNSKKESSYSSFRLLDSYEMNIPKDICFSSMESVHGLICFPGSAKPIIWNPTMRQFITLPKPEKSRIKGTTVFLGYNPIEGKHKVVCMARDELCNVCWVLTLGSSPAQESHWRKIETNHHHRPYVGIYRKVPCINGVLYYKAFDHMKNRVVVSFDVRSEKFKLITVPLGTIWGLLIAYEGRLAFVNSFYANNCECTKLSVLEDVEKEEWLHKSFRVPLSALDSSLKTSFQLGGITDGVFDPKTHNFRKVVYDGIVDEEFRLSNGLGDGPFKAVHAFPNYIESLISLKAGVGEEIIQEPKIKLKNLCNQILKKDGGSMKLKQLRSLINEQAPSLLSEFSSSKDAIAYLKHKLERSGKFLVEGKTISLV